MDKMTYAKYRVPTRLGIVKQLFPVEIEELLLFGSDTKSTMNYNIAVRPNTH